MLCHLASSDDIRLSLPDGHFLTVKKELNAGEGLDLDDSVGNRTIETILAYLVGWSLVGPDNTPLPYSPMQSIEERRATLRALKTAAMDDIGEALVPHIRANRRVVAEKKTIPEPVSA